MLSDNFDVLMSKIRTKILKKIILMYFRAKNTFERHLAPQYQTRVINLSHKSEFSFFSFISFLGQERGTGLIH